MLFMQLTTFEILRNVHFTDWNVISYIWVSYEILNIILGIIAHFIVSLGVFFLSYN